MEDSKSVTVCPSRGVIEAESNIVVLRFGGETVAPDSDIHTMTQLNEAYNNHKIIIAMSENDAFVPVTLKKSADNDYQGAWTYIFYKSVGGLDKTMLRYYTIRVQSTSGDMPQVQVLTIQKLLD